MEEQEQQVNPLLADRPVGAILWSKAKRPLGLAPAPDLASSSGLMQTLQWMEEAYGWVFPTVVQVHPGSGKSRDATELVEEAWRNRGKKGLYLMLSHDAIEERLERLREDGKGEDWEHWRGHDRSCPARLAQENGYQGKCTCGRPEKFEARGPTLAPIDYALPMRPGDGTPMLRAAEQFDFWIVDEVDFRRFLGITKATRDDVQVVARTHPDSYAKQLAPAIDAVMGQPGDTSGIALLKALDEALDGRLVTVANMLSTSSLPDRPWEGVDASNPPVNFIPTLVPILLEEAQAWSKGQLLNPRIHIVGHELHIWWRKEFSGHRLPPTEGDLAGYFPPPAIILDATADPGLLSWVFPEADWETESIAVPEWPANVHVHQWTDGLVSRRTLGVQGKPEVRERWYARAVGALQGAGIDNAAPIGLITHMAIEQEAGAALRAAGFEDVRTLHFGDERGSNKMEDVRALVVLGLPIPNIAEFREEAQAFLYDTGPLSLDWREEPLVLKMRDGSATPVAVGGYWDGRVGRYYAQKCQAGLYQSIHRIRPYLPRPYDRHIFIFTNMPVGGVVVDELLRSGHDVRINSRARRAFEVIAQRIEAVGECLVPDLARVLAAEEASDEKIVARWPRGTRLCSRSPLALGSFPAGGGGQDGLLRHRHKRIYKRVSHWRDEGVGPSP